MKSNYFSLMNSKLDEGYKLTDQPCEKCSTNYLISPDFKQFFCCKCNFFTEAEISDQLQAEAPEQQKDDSYLQQDMQDINFDKQKQTEIVSKKMGDYLLQGYTMLNEICETCGVPLMKYKTQKEFCVGCLTQPKAKTSQKSNEELELPEQDYQQFKKQIKSTKEDDHSQKIADYLTQGYIMMKECCSKCLLPLMKSQKGTAICVGCQQLYKFESQIEMEKQEGQKISKTIEKKQNVIQSEVNNSNNNIAQNNKNIQNKITEKFQETEREIFLLAADYYKSQIKDSILNNNENKIKEIIQNVSELNKKFKLI